MVITYQARALTGFNFNGEGVGVDVDGETGEVTIEMEAAVLTFDSVTGKFQSITGDENAAGEFFDEATNPSLTFDLAGDTEGTPFKRINIDFSALTMFSQSGTTTLECARGTRASAAEGAGKPVGNMTGLTTTGIPIF